MDLPAQAVRIAMLPLTAAGGALSLIRELAAVPARLTEIAEALTVLPDVQRQLARIEARVAAATPVPEELGAAMHEMPEVVRQLDAAVAQLVGLVDDLVGSVARIDGANAPVDPDLQPVQAAADQVGRLAGRLRVRRRRFARAAG